MPPKGYKLSAQAKENIRQAILRRGVEARVDPNELRALYWDKQLCVREIAQLKGVTDSCVFQWFWHFKIPRRSPSEFTKLAYSKRPYPLRGRLSPSWKGGKHVHCGYIYIRIYPDGPFYGMGEKARGPARQVAEHRLVMAQHLGRPLEPWEIVHHKGSKYPQGSIEDKQDNRIENLKLYPEQASHVTHTMFKRELHKRDKEIRLLQWQVRILTQRLNKSGIPLPEELQAEEQHEY